MTDYITIDGFSQRFGVTLSDKNVRILDHIHAASGRVNTITGGRDFGPGDGVATARYFRPSSCESVYIDDAYEITSVAVDDGDTGTYTTWATTEYETDPANGVGPDGKTGWPAYLIRTVGSYTFPTANRRRAVKVTAKWGWAAVPDAVIEATYLLANRLYFEVDVPGGVTPPNIEFGIPGTPLRRPYTAEDLLAPYIRPDQAIGVAG